MIFKIFAFANTVGLGQAKRVLFLESSPYGFGTLSLPSFCFPFGKEFRIFLPVELSDWEQLFLCCGRYPVYFRPEQRLWFSIPALFCHCLSFVSSYCDKILWQNQSRGKGLFSSSFQIPYVREARQELQGAAHIAPHTQGQHAGSYSTPFLPSLHHQPRIEPMNGTTCIQGGSSHLS